MLGQNEHPVLVVRLREARHALRALPEAADFDTSLTSAQSAALRHAQALVQVGTLRTRVIHTSKNFLLDELAQVEGITVLYTCEQLRALCAFNMRPCNT